MLISQEANVMGEGSEGLNPGKGEQSFDSEAAWQGRLCRYWYTLKSALALF